MKYSLLSLTAIMIILGTSMYYSGRGSKVADGNQTAVLPLPTEVSEVGVMPLLAENSEPHKSEIITEVITLAATNDNLDVVKPTAEGTITEEAATDSQNFMDTDEEQKDTVTVPLTAQTGANLLIFWAAAISLMAGGFGLMIFPVAAARG